MKKFLVFLTILLFLILLWYTKSIYQKCCEDNNKTVDKELLKKEKIISEKEPAEALIFNWNSEKAITNELWDKEKAEIIANMVDEKILQITGPYFKEEGEELGILRAKTAFAKLELEIDSAKVEYKSKLVEFYDNAKTEPFAGTEFKWLVRNNNIQEIDNKTIIYFPTNSSKRINNKNIINYLKDVAKYIKETNKVVNLSGHSDNRGDAAVNKKLALKRANAIKDELIILGVNEGSIIVVSYGEEKPIADNSTKEGQQKNRRVELEIKQ